MIMIKQKAKKKKMLDYFVSFRKKQNFMETDDSSIYSIIPIGTALKFNVLIKDFLLHSLLVKKRKFYEDIEFITTKKELIEIITKVLDLELVKEPGKSEMSDDAINELVAAHTRLTKKKAK